MNNELKSFKDLKVWQKAADLATLVYKTTEKFPRSELYGITNQMRRAAVSISSNLAEGFKRIYPREKSQFYNIAYSSISELESQVEISKKLGFLSENDYQKLLLAVTEVSKMTDGLIKSLNSKSYILNSSRGFSLLELLIYVAVLAIVTVIVSGFFLAINKGRGQVDARTEVNQNIRFALSAIERDLSAASSVTVPATTGATSSVLTLISGGNTVTYATTTLNRLQRTVNSLSEVIVSERVKIDSLSFVRLENTSNALGKTFVSVETGLGVSYDSESPDQQYSAARKTTMSLR
ncbi:MAG: four helix bundle protein [Parcubacteria group bacterium]|nr:four helix bundle protein [Parcubacteria group bacterium]